MKILVTSDSHGAKNNIVKAIALETPDAVLHLGDRITDCIDAELEYPDILLRSIRGNCDRSSALDIDEFVLCGKRFLMTHGHLYGVKTGYSRVIDAAIIRCVDVLLFGHTHIPYYSVIDDIVIVNPGSIGEGSRSYAVLDITDKQITCEHKRL